MEDEVTNERLRLYLGALRRKPIAAAFKYCHEDTVADLISIIEELQRRRITDSANPQHTGDSNG